MTRRENEPPEDNYPDGVLMIFAGRDPGRTKAALLRARNKLKVSQHMNSDSDLILRDDIRMLDELIVQFDG